MDACGVSRKYNCNIIGIPRGNSRAKVWGERYSAWNNDSRSPSGSGPQCRYAAHSWLFQWRANFFNMRSSGTEGNVGLHEPAAPGTLWWHFRIR
jgi:hypothetical protein